MEKSDDTTQIVAIPTMHFNHCQTITASENIFQYLIMYLLDLGLFCAKYTLGGGTQNNPSS